MAVLVWAIAALEVAVVGFFAVQAMSGDAWGIARSMALLLAVPIVGMTLPAVFLLRAGRRRSAGALAIASLVVMGALWRLA